MAQALKQIVEYLAESDLTVLNSDEVILFSLLETYADLSNSKVIETIIQKVKTNKINEYGRARRDLLLVAQSIQTRILQQARISRARRIVSSEELEKLFSEQE